MANFDSTSYRLYVKMSHRKHLLVEGRTDKQFFILLKDKLFGANNISIEFEIECVETFDGFPQGTGNREKVESISFAMSSSEFDGRFVGFVDREYRDFEFNTIVKDLLNGHYVNDKLVWSRGHSIESYFSDFSILQEPLKALCVSHNVLEALESFRKVLESTLQVISALSLTASLEHDSWERIIGGIHWKLLISSSDRVEINLEKWQEILENRGYSKQKIKSIIESFQKWLRVVSASDQSILQWLCHGHIGLHVFRQIFARCLYETCYISSSKKPESEVHRAFLRVSQPHLANSLANVWASKAKNDLAAFPREVFSSLGIAMKKANIY